MNGNKQGTTTQSDDSTPVSGASKSSTSKLKVYTQRELEMENFDLVAKVLWIINIAGLWSEDGTFTFPDGETWAELDRGKQDETDRE